MDQDPNDQALAEEMEGLYPFIFGGGKRDALTFLQSMRQLRDGSIPEFKHAPTDVSGFSDYKTAVQAMKDIADNFLDDADNHHYPELETYYKQWDFLPQCTLAILVLLNEENKERVLQANNKVGIWQKWGDKLS